MKLTYDGLIFEDNSFAIYNRELILAIDKLGVDISLAAWGQGRDSGIQIEERLLELMDKPRYRNIWLRHSWPKCDPYYDAKYNWSTINARIKIGLTFWESEKLPDEWIDEMQCVDYIIIATKKTKETFINNGIEEDKIKIVPGGVNLDKFNPNRIPVNIDTNKSFKFLHLGWAQPRKGTDVLIKAFSEEFTNKDDCCLVIKSPIGDWFAKVPNPNIIYDIGIANDISGYYSSCNCAVYPTLLEGFGLYILECFASKLPIIITQEGCYRDFVTEDNAILINSERKPYTYVTPGFGNYPDKEHLKYLMREAYENPNTSKSDRAYKDVQDWTWEKAALKFQKEFKDV